MTGAMAAARAAVSAAAPATASLRGAAFEAAAVTALAPLGFLLRRRGGPGDAGVDLIGRLEVPGSAPPVAVVAQCKAEARPLGPAYVRELEGVLALRAGGGAAAASSQSSGLLLGLLVSASAFTPASIR